MVTQNYFIQGKHSRDIRNSCNYVALFRNCADAGLNKRVATAFGLKEAYQAAERDTYTNQIYPYMFIDQTQRAQLSTYRLYTEILGPFKKVYNSDGMRGFILTEKDFLAAYRVLETKQHTVLAVRKNENSTKDLSRKDNKNDNSDGKEKRKTKREKIRQKIVEQRLGKNIQ